MFKKNQNELPKSIEPRGVALIPLFCFISLFLGAGLYFESQGVKFAFYELSSVVAIGPCVSLAIVIAKDPALKALNQFIDGIGNSTIITMCLIFLLAGGFASVAKATGGIEATTSLGLSFIPSSFLLPGFFLITAFISTAMGTSMGTLAAVSPIALSISQAANIDTSYMAGCIVSGAMFGDNLSIISDTTIASTRTQGCEMRDKFKENLIFALPSAAITILFFTAVQQVPSEVVPEPYDIIAVTPYLTILILALSGLNVFAVLSIGILLAGGIGVSQSDYSLIEMGKDLYKGFSSMQDIFLLSMLIGGLANITHHQGGLAYIHDRIEKVIAVLAKIAKNNKDKAAEVGVGLLVALSNLCLANNTVAILITGQIAKNISQKHHIIPKRTASVLDIFSCIIQGLIPYGAQVLLVSQTFKITPLETSSHVWYCMILAAITILFILFKSQPMIEKEDS